MMMRQSPDGRALVAAVIATALGELGQREWLNLLPAKKGVPGARRARKGEKPGKENPRISGHDGYHSATRGGPASERVPWCSSFACWVLERCGVESPRSKAGVDFETWGEPAIWQAELVNPSDADHYVFNPFGVKYESGLLLVLDRDNPDTPQEERHIVFCLGEDGERLLVVAGNTGNEVKKYWIHKSSVLAARRYSRALTESRA